MKTAQHILLIEDNPGDAELIRVILCQKETTGFLLHTETTLKDSLSYLDQKNPVDVVLLDLGLPDSRGLEGLGKIRARFPFVPVVVLTGNTDQKMGEDALKNGAQDYVVKGQLPEHYLLQVIRYAIQRQESEARLRQSEEKYRGIVDNLAIGVALIDAQKNIIETNEKLRLWFPSVATGKPSKCYQTIQCLCDGVADFDQCPVAKTIKNGQTHKDISSKGPYTYRLISTALKDSKGNLKGVILLKEDITKRINMEKKLRQAQKMESLGTLAGGVAHDFNNILTAIQGFATLAHFEAGENKTLHKDLSEISKASDRAAELVRQILTFSRMADFEKKPIIISPLISEVLKMLRSTLPANIEIISNIKKETGPIVADPTQIHQILMNLCTNAAHAMERHGGTLTVSLVQESAGEASGRLLPTLARSNRLKLTVQDTGTGIAQEIKDSIFDPYFTTKGIGEGTGLGLSVVQGIVKDCGGDILVDSAPGSGSAFHLYFPVSRPIKGPPPIKKDLLLPNGQGHILFVDDETQILKLGVRLLEKLGYDVHTEPDGKQAFKYVLANQEKIDLIISDMNMPEMTGLELAKKTRKLAKKIPFFIITGYNRLLSSERCSEYGIDAVLIKPLVASELAAQIKLAIAP